MRATPGEHVRRSDSVEESASDPRSGMTGFLGRGKEEKGEKKKKRWAGWVEKERGKRKAFPFLKRFKHIQFKFKLIQI